MNIYEKLKEPELNIIASVLLISNGWLVGKAPLQIINGEEIKDFDIIVCDMDLFGKAIKVLSAIHQGYDINSYGGMKFQMKELTIDIWCGDLSHFLMTAKNIDYIYNFSKNIALKLTDLK